jgi:hypothetical protein
MGNEVKARRVCITYREYTSPAERLQVKLESKGLWGFGLALDMIEDWKGLEVRGWEGSEGGMYILKIPAQGNCVIQAVVLSLKSVIVGDKTASRMREKIEENMREVKWIKQEWEKSYTENRLKENKAMGHETQSIPQTEIEVEWQKELQTAKGCEAKKTPFLGPIHVFVLAQLVKKHIVVLEPRWARVSSTETKGQMGGIYTVRSPTGGTPDVDIETIVIAFSNSHCGSVVKLPQGKDTCRIKIAQAKQHNGTEVQWRLKRRFEGAVEGKERGPGASMATAQDGAGGMWADMAGGGRVGNIWENMGRRQEKAQGVKRERQGEIKDRESKSTNK